MNQQDTNTYWEQRGLDDAAHRINLTEDMINRELAQVYEQAEDMIYEDIQQFYQKYAKQKNISMAEAKRRIKTADFEDIDFESLSYQAIETSDMELHDLLHTLAQKGQITRLELLQLDVQSILANLFHQEQMNVYEYLVDTYTDSYYRSIYNTDVFFGFRSDFAKISQETIHQAVTQSWIGDHYSHRIWGHRQELGQELMESISQGLIRGHGADKMARNIAKDMEVSFGNAKRLVRTETSYVHNQATKDAYQGYANIQKYKYLATLDFKTSPKCQKLDGQIMLVSEAKVGENYPPLHPNCRSTTVPYFDHQAISHRIARRSDGKNEMVPSNMTYQEWFNSLPQQEQQAILLERKKAQNRLKDQAQHKRYKQMLGKEAPRSFAKFSDMKYNDPEGYKELKKKYIALNRVMLSNDEQYAINKYISSESYIINEKLRNHLELTEDDTAFIRHLDRGLKKMPDYQGLVTRSVELEGHQLEQYLAQHQPDHKINYSAYTSFTKGSVYSPDANIQLYVDSTKGKDISLQNTAEQEILYQRNSVFKIKEIEKYNGQYHIFMEEHKDD